MINPAFSPTLFGAVPTSPIFKERYDEAQRLLQDLARRVGIVSKLAPLYVDTYSSGCCIKKEEISFISLNYLLALLKPSDLPERFKITKENRFYCSIAYRSSILEWSAEFLGVSLGNLDREKRQKYECAVEGFIQLLSYPQHFEKVKEFILAHEIGHIKIREEEEGEGGLSFLLRWSGILFQKDAFHVSDVICFVAACLAAVAIIGVTFLSVGVPLSFALNAFVAGGFSAGMIGAIGNHVERASILARRQEELRADLIAASLGEDLRCGGHYWAVIEDRREEFLKWMARGAVEEPSKESGWCDWIDNELKAWKDNFGNTHPPLCERVRAFAMLKPPATQVASG